MKLKIIFLLTFFIGHTNSQTIRVMTWNFQSTVNEMNEILGREKEKVAKILEEKKKIDKLQNDINSRNAEIDRLKKEINKSSGFKKIELGVTNGAKITKLGFEIAGLEIAHKTSTAAIDAAYNIAIGALKSGGLFPILERRRKYSSRTN